jgi:predicted RNase H-like HicB family nuclease
MENYRFRVIIEKDEDGIYVSTVPALKGCHTQAKTLDELMERTKEAIELYLEYQDDKFTDAAKLDFVGLQEIEVMV